MKPMLWVEYSRKTMQAYEKAGKPLCAELGISQTAFDILLFLANNPSRNTAKDIVELRGFKANLVSINVDKLVNEGYLERSADKKDRRKVILSCTPKADPIIQTGRAMQEQFYTRLIANVPAASLQAVQEAFRIISNNIDEIWREQP